MYISFHGQPTDQPVVRIGTIGCGSHSFRNIYATFQYVPVDLVATCDLLLEKAQAFADKFGAKSAYQDYREMLSKESLDAVFVVVGYDSKGRPRYPEIVVDCLERGCHVWIEKPPAFSTAEITRMKEASERTGKNVVVGLKKMFMPANEKAKQLMDEESFGRTSLVMTQYPQHIPSLDEFDRYLNKEECVWSVVGFLDHLCHPMSLIVFLLGMPKTLYYERAPNAAGLATFTFESGIICSLGLTIGSSINGGMERTCIISDRGRHIVVENNIRLAYHRTPPSEPGTTYGSSPNFFTGTPDQTTAVWEPEFSLGQLYNKGLFLIGYYNEINEFVRSILEKRQPLKGTLDQAWQVTRVFEAFAEGPGKLIQL